MKRRIWELDAFRGLCILGVIIVHFVYDLVDLFGLVPWQYPAWFALVMDWGGIVFLVLSGICVTLGSRCVRRGLIVFGCGMLCTAVTTGMYGFGFTGKGIIIYFGVLHCLGICMLLWPVFKKYPPLLLAGLGILLAGLGLYLKTLRVDFPWLIPLGVRHSGFASSDYFPLLPNLGYFLIGAAIGRTAYREKQTLLPRINENTPVLRFFGLCGRHSLWIYLLHQPLLALILSVITVFGGV